MNEQMLEQVVIKKVTWRLIPFLVLTYFVCYLDRVNVGFAALTTMNKDLALPQPSSEPAQAFSFWAIFCLKCQAILLFRSTERVFGLHES